MPKFAAHEAETADQVQQWHDEAYAEYEKALKAYEKVAKGDGTDGTDKNKTRLNYEEARDNLVAGTQYWRQVGEQVGTRTGVVTEDNSL